MDPRITEEKLAEISELLFKGERIAAIKIHRELANVGLKAAKDEIEKLEATLRMRVPDQFTSPPRGSGCLGLIALIGTTSALLGYWATRN